MNSSWIFLGHVHHVGVLGRHARVGVAQKVRHGPQARYEIVEDDGSFFGDIPAIPGVWANAKTLEACREELESVLEGWVLLSIADHSPIPDIDGNRLEIREVASMPAIGPIKRKDLIACLRSLGFEPPVSLALEIEVPFAA
jgi:predicted RNase H-like HicB family nuclease